MFGNNRPYSFAMATTGARSTKRNKKRALDLDVEVVTHKKVTTILSDGTRKTTRILVPLVPVSDKTHELESSEIPVEAPNNVEDNYEQPIDNEHIPRIQSKVRKEIYPQ